MTTAAELAKETKARFQTTFRAEPSIVVWAPGRINLIGGHTDYNDGFVLPVAIDRGVVIAALARDDRLVRIHAANFGKQSTFKLEEISYSTSEPWSNYPRGVARSLQEHGLALTGMDMTIWGNVPVGAGLSSSAAVEVATGVVLQILGRFELDRTELARLCQRAENEFVGVRCGIMDQLIAALGRRGHALLIDCRNLDHEWVSLPSHVRIVVTDTGVRRELASSEYNVRRQQCEQAARLLDVPSLRDVSPESFETEKGHLPATIRKRCRHVVYENQRVLKGAQALRSGDLTASGRLMDQSHASLRDDYDVSCRELEAIVAAAREVEGVFGSRMTGAGFGGAVVSLVDAQAVDDFAQKVSQSYQKSTGLESHVYVCEAANGVREVQ